MFLVCICVCTKVCPLYIIRREVFVDGQIRKRFIDKQLVMHLSHFYDNVDGSLYLVCIFIYVTL